MFKFKRVLVPLDGSKMAECVLSCVEELAARGVAKEFILVSVTERVKGYRVISDYSKSSEERLAPEAAGKKGVQAQKYLNKIAKGLTDKGVNVQTLVLIGNPAEEIVLYADAMHCDLIVMASHGKSGPSRWTHGSVVDKVFRATRLTIMVVRPPGCIISD